jgi:hypothetical protein
VRDPQTIESEVLEILARSGSPQEMQRRMRTYMESLAPAEMEYAKQFSIRHLASLTEKLRQKLNSPVNIDSRRKRA